MGLFARARQLSTKLTARPAGLQPFHRTSEYRLHPGSDNTPLNETCGSPKPRHRQKFAVSGCWMKSEMRDSPYPSIQVPFAISASRHRHGEAGPRIDHCPWLGAASGFAGLSPQAARRVGVQGHPWPRTSGNDLGCTRRRTRQAGDGHAVRSAR